MSQHLLQIALTPEQCQAVRDWREACGITADHIIVARLEDVGRRQVAAVGYAARHQWPDDAQWGVVLGWLRKPAATALRKALQIINPQTTVSHG